MVSAEVPGIDAVLEHGVGGSEHRGRARDDGLLRAPATLEAEELRAEGAVLLAGGGPRALGEGGLQPGVAGADAGGPALAGPLVEARTEPGPGDEMAGRGKAGHVQADLGAEDAGDGLADARPGDQSVDGGAKRGEGAARLPDNAELQYHLGMAAARTGDKDVARKALAFAAASPAAFKGKDEAQRTLAELK